jgi:pimeloyl-ACP methyl ester carboxylesterase
MVDIAAGCSSAASSCVSVVAHTISFDGRVMGATMSGKPLPAESAALTTPTLVLSGGDGEAFMRNSGVALAALLPNARRRTLPVQSHAVSAEAVAPVLIEFFG